MYAKSRWKVEESIHPRTVLRVLKRMRSAPFQSCRFNSAALICCTLSAISMTRAEPMKAATSTLSIEAPSFTKCIGASMCVPLCAPRVYVESVSASPFRMSLRNVNTIGASPS